MVMSIALTATGSLRASIGRGAGRVPGGGDRWREGGAGGGRQGQVDGWWRRGRAGRGRTGTVGEATSTIVQRKAGGDTQMPAAG